jgi:hypothetical protein
MIFLQVKKRESAKLLRNLERRVNMYPDVLSIAKTAERCNAEGIPLSEKALRHFVKSKAIPAIQTGKKALLFFPNVRKFVESGNTEEENERGLIRKVRG